MKDVGDLIKAGFILIIGVALLSGIGLSKQLVDTFTNLGVFMIIMAIIIALISIFIPILKR